MPRKVPRKYFFRKKADFVQKKQRKARNLAKAV